MIAVPRDSVLLAWFLMSAVAAICVQVSLQLTFASVAHPVTLAAANLEPDPVVVRGWYAQLVDQGTYLQMIRTELVDLLWPICLAAAIVSLYRLIGGLLRRVHGPIARLLFRLAPLAGVGPAFDIFENAFSLAMLTDPFGFPDWWSYAHVGASWAKIVGSAAAAVVGTTLTVTAVLLGRRRRDGSTIDGR